MLTVAAFDLDGTITDRDCLIPFLRETVGTRTLGASVIAALARNPRALRQRDLLKELVVKPLAGRTSIEINQTARDFVESRVASWFRPEMVERIIDHKDRAHHVVIVSASLDPYVAVIGEQLGVAHLATRLETQDGVLTGRLNGPNCRSSEKVIRLQQWTHERFGTSLESIDLHAYGDSAGDRELLAAAQHSHLVRPMRRWSPA